MKTWVDIFILGYFFLLNSFYGLLLALSFLEIARRKSWRLPEMDSTILSRGTAPPIAIIAPAYNEAANIVDSVRSLLNVRYPDHQVIVVNDGSTDETFQLLVDHFDLERIDRVVHRQIETEPVRGIYRSPLEERLLVVDKENGGKGDALNVGINVSRAPLVCCVDADTIIEEDALLRMVEPYIYDPSSVVGVGGTVRVANGCTLRDERVDDIQLPDSWLARFQIVEYLRAFLFGRMGMNRLGGNLIISGAFGLFLKEAVVEVEGYDDETVGEDMELVVRLHRYGRQLDPIRRIVQIPDPICFTRVPEDIRTLGLQRDRWHRGMADTLLIHRRMFLNPRYGSIGMVIYPVFVFFELLGPLVELFGYFWFVTSIIFGFVNWEFAFLFLIVAFIWGALLSIQSLVLDNWSFEMFRGGESRTGLIVAALVENLGYRQMTLWFRLRGLVKYVMGESSWGDMNRKGFDKAPDDEGGGKLEEEEKAGRKAEGAGSEGEREEGERVEGEEVAEVSTKPAGGE